MNSPRRVTFRIPNLFHSDSPLITMLLAITALLVGFGLLMVMSASSVTSGINNDGNFFHDAMTQSLGVGIGVAAALIISRWPLDIWRRYRNAFIALGILLQGAVLVAGKSYGGNTNWISIGGVSMQPSEFIKLAIIVWLAVWIHDNPHHFDQPLMYWWDRQFGWVLAPIGMVMLGGDLGTTIIIGLIIMGMLVIAGAPARPLAFLAGSAAVAAVMYVMVSGSSRTSRFSIWLTGCKPEDYEGACWQTIHGYWALGSGGLFGLGAGSSRSKWSWLPHAESDYIFAIIGEEFGLLGAIFVLLVLIALAVTLVRLMREYPQPLTRTLIAGVLVWIVGQSLVNIAVVLGILPVLGVPLPMVSSGGSAILANLLAIGVVVSCVRYEEQYG
ncbi:MAG: putative lipid flippase FtsW [Actinomycetota bacterium]